MSVRASPTLRTPRWQLQSQQVLKALLLLSVVAPALVFILYAGLTHSQVYKDAEIRARHISSILQEHALKVFETVDLALRLTNERLRDVDWETIRSSRALWEELRNFQTSKEQLGSIYIMEPDGRLALTTRVFPPPDTNFSDRDYFIVQKEADAGLYIGQAYVGKISEAPIFNFSIRRSQNGNFNGIIGSSAFVEYLQQFYRGIGDHPADNFSVLLVRDDGNVLARYPAADIGLKFPPESEFRKSISQSNEGIFYAHSPIDGLPRLYAFTKLRTFPASVMYSIDRSSILRDWYRRMAFSGAIAATFACIIFVITSIALRRAKTEAIAVHQLTMTSRSLQEEVERRQRAEASLVQAQRLEAVGRLTGGIAHDFNNLLQIISGNLEIAQRRSDPASIKRPLKSAEYAAQRGADLTRQLLAFSSQQALHSEVVNMNEVLEKARTWAGRSISEAIAIELTLADGLWPVRVDVAQLEFALLNLVVNARDAMPEGGKIVFQTANVVLNDYDISAQNLAISPGPYAMISISDTGSGIPPEVLARAYEPFFTTKEVGKGTGLGLSQVYGFVRQSDGGISLESEVNRGTTVRLYLPRCEIAAEPEEQSVSLSSTEPASRNEVVLIVEDNEEVRRIAAAMLDDLGYSMVTARNGLEALALLSAGEPIGILFSDVVMPRGVSGIELAEQALKIRPDLKILLTTASIEVDTRFPLLRKPFSQAELSRKIIELSDLPSCAVSVYRKVELRSTS